MLGNDMNTRGASILACTLLVALLCGCKKDSKVPMAPGGGDDEDGGGRPPVGGTVGGGAGMMSTDDDGGTTGPASDAGTMSGTLGFARHCHAVSPTDAMDVDVPINMRPSGATSPADFVITREAANWVGTCADPKLEIELSGGHCSTGDGHELDIVIAKSAIDDGTLVPGENILLPEPDARGITIRYHRPKKLGADNGVGDWGTCSGATGQIVFTDLPDVSGRTALSARFLLQLTHCDGITEITDAGKTATQEVDGAFNVTVEAGSSAYCSK
jgi:hypothetical protein